MTTDVDLVIHLIPENLKPAMKSLTALGYRPKVPVQAVEFADPAKREFWIREKGMVVFQLVSDEFRWEPIDGFVQSMKTGPTKPDCSVDDWQCGGWADHQRTRL
jgi:hypothetical protein